jgi:serine protease Do
MVGCALAAIASVRADEGPFAQAVAAAQQRTVKIYGAGIGRVSGFGTGVVVSPEGDILTAEGVILFGERIRVTLPDGTMHEAKLVRSNHELQVALLKIDVPTPQYFALADQPPLEKGSWVVAVSNAFKVADRAEPLSVTLGIVSLRTRLDARRGTQDSPYLGDLLLIDCITSNPGAAGGAVVTADGRLAGMIGKIIESKSTNTRLNYAVPVDLLDKFVRNELESFAPVVATTDAKAELGIRLFRLGGRNAPAYIDRVIPNSPAAQAGLRPDDLVISIGGQAIRNVSEYRQVVDTLKPGEEVLLLVKRGEKVEQFPITPVAEDSGE